MSWIKRVFVSPKFGLRAAWLVIIGYAVYYAWTNGVTVAMSYGFTALFGAWGLTAENLTRAPAWARFIALYYGAAISLIVSAGICIFSYLWFGKREKIAFRGKAFALSAVIGFAGAGLGGALMLLFDSLRLADDAICLSFEPVLLCAVIFASCAAEEFFVRRFAFALVFERVGLIAAHAVAAILLLLTSAISGLNRIGIANTALISVLMCELSRRRGAWTAIGARFGWSALVTFVLASPSQTAAQAPLWQTYPVSEAWLTGGAGGAICGLWTTFIVLTALGVLVRVSLRKQALS